MMPPPMMTTRAWVGKFVAITPSSRPEPRGARRSGGTRSWGSSPRGGPSAPLRYTRDDGASQPPRYGGFVHFAHLRHAGLHRVAAGRGVDGGHLGELVEMAFLDAELGQGVRDADLAAQLEAPVHEAIEGRAAQAEPARQALDLVVDGGAIELQD